MANPFHMMAKAQRLARAGRPLAAVMTLQRIVTAAPTVKRPPKAVAKRAKQPPAPALLPVRPAPGSFAAGRFKSAHGNVAYKLYTPPGSSRRRMALVVMLHGCGQSADDFALGTGMNALADEYGFLVLYPEQSASANIGRCWNWHRTADQQRDVGEPAVIAALTRQIATVCKANPDRIYIAGMSAGAALAALTASTYPELFVALGVHSGLLPGKVRTLGGAIAAMRDGTDDAAPGKLRAPPPTIVFHGDQDGTVHPANARRFLNRLGRSSARPLVSRIVRGRSGGGRDYTRTIHRHADGAVLLEDWVVHRSGHGWSGGHRGGSFTDPAGPDASREMLRFFLARKKEAAPRR